MRLTKWNKKDRCAGDSIVIHRNDIKEIAPRWLRYKDGKNRMGATITKHNGRVILVIETVELIKITTAVVPDNSVDKADPVIEDFVGSEGHD